MLPPPITQCWTQSSVSPRRRSESVLCRAASSRGLSARRKAPDAGSPLTVGGLPRGSGRCGPGYPEGAGSGPRNQASRKTGIPSTLHPRFSKVPPSAETLTPRSAMKVVSPRLEDALSEALRGLGGAQGALSDASRQLSQEARRRSSEAWRLHRLEQVMAASLGGFSRELRSLRMETARHRGEVGSRSRCRSCSRC